MEKLFTCLMLFLALVSQAVAERIPEQEAYKVAQQFFATGKMMAPGGSQVAQQLQLTHTSAAYYAFNRGEGNGYVLVAADDRFSNEVLGYADKGTFDVDNMPANMKWWLSQYDSALQAAQQGTLKPQRLELPQIPEKVTLSKAAKSSAQAGRTTIAPMLSSSWGQGEPYNLMCPTYEGERCVTGCVATAMSQIMYYHQYPTKGRGAKRYVWKVNDVTQKTLSISFSAHTYNYAAMTDTYGAGSSTESRNAVAQLMYDAGVSVEMGYTPQESGAYDRDAAIGLVENFQYDKSSVLLQRNYYEDEEWVEILYTSLANDGPVYYSGQSQQGGHAFVCDGYDDGYFHINWGWDGNSNAYFLLDPLGGYSYSQSALINLTPAKEGSDYTPLMYCTDDFVSEESGYTNYALFLGGFYNFGISTREMTLGIKVVNKVGAVSWIASDATQDIESYTGYGGFYFDLSNFPSAAGEYLVYPAYRDEVTGIWYEMRTPISSSKRYLIATVSGSSVTFSSPEVQQPELAVSLVSTSEIVAEQAFTAEFDFSNSGGYYEEEVILCVVEKDADKILTNSSSVLVQVPTGASRAVTFQLNAPATAGDYDLVLINSDMYAISDRFPITVEESPDPLRLSLTSLAVENPSSAPIDKICVSAQIACESGYYNGYAGFAVFPEEGGTSIDLVYQEFAISAGETKGLSYVGAFKDLEVGKTYYIAPVIYFGTSGWEVMNGIFFRTGVDTGIDEVGQESASTETSVYNMSGACVLRFEAGSPVDTSTLESGVYVVKSGNTVRKIVVNN